MQSSPDPGPVATIAPSHNGQALYVQGLLALKGGDAAAAVDLLTTALRLQPEHAGMRRNLVRALLVCERFDQVLAAADAALDMTPDDAELHYARATALNALGRSIEAFVAFERALSLAPDHAACWLNLGNALVDLGKHELAETRYRTAIRLDPELAEAHTSLGYLLTALGRLPEAIAACEAAIRLRPAFVQAHWNLAIAALLAGDLPRGFEEYEWRKRHRRYHADFPPLPGPVWDGGDPASRTILVRAEQGIGDTVQFARYLPMIRAAGGAPVLLCSPVLIRLIRSLPGITAVTAADPLPRYDAWIDQASLPRAFNTTLQSVPAADGYLRADPERVGTWHARLPTERLVGVAFSGNPKHQGDKRRSIPLDLVGSLPDIAGLSFISLHHGASADGLGLANLTPLLTDYAETAALIENLDLVITVDTSVAHLAGALGKPVWILLPYAPDWRWLLARTDSPWYRSARLFRQPSAGDWSSVLAEVWGALP